MSQQGDGSGHGVCAAPEDRDKDPAPRQSDSGGQNPQPQVGFPFHMCLSHERPAPGLIRSSCSHAGDICKQWLALAGLPGNWREGVILRSLKGHSSL